jgi:hypothetical protein
MGRSTGKNNKVSSKAVQTRAKLDGPYLDISNAETFTLGLEEVSVVPEKFLAHIAPLWVGKTTQQKAFEKLEELAENEGGFYVYEYGDPDRVSLCLSKLNFNKAEIITRPGSEQQALQVLVPEDYTGPYRRHYGSAITYWAYEPVSGKWVLLNRWGADGKVVKNKSKHQTKVVTNPLWSGGQYFNNAFRNKKLHLEGKKITNPKKADLAKKGLSLS